MGVLVVSLRKDAWAQPVRSHLINRLLLSKDNLMLIIIDNAWKPNVYKQNHTWIMIACWLTIIEISRTFSTMQTANPTPSNPIHNISDWLTHLGMDETVAYNTRISNWISLPENLFWLPFHWICSYGLDWVDYISALVQVMVWRLFSASIVAQYIDVIWCLWAKKSFIYFKPNTAFDYQFS